MRDGHLLPSMFVYRVGEQIRLLCPLAQPTEMLLDFEKAAINSFEEVWPDTLVKCCFFQLTQNVWRKVQAAGLQASYSQDEELAMRIRLLPALAYAPLQDVRGLFAALAAHARGTELVLYFERTYIAVPYRPVAAGDHPS